MFLNSLYLNKEPAYRIDHYYFHPLMSYFAFLYIFSSTVSSTCAHLCHTHIHPHASITARSMCYLALHQLQQIQSDKLVITTKHAPSSIYAVVFQPSLSAHPAAFLLWFGTPYCHLFQPPDLPFGQELPVCSGFAWNKVIFLPSSWYSSVLGLG